jgi:hypothetical protein
MEQLRISVRELYAYDKISSDQRRQKNIYNL